LPRCNQLIV